MLPSVTLNTTIRDIPVYKGKKKIKNVYSFLQGPAELQVPVFISLLASPTCSPPQNSCSCRIQVFWSLMNSSMLIARHTYVFSSFFQLSDLFPVQWIWLVAQPEVRSWENVTVLMTGELSYTQRETLHPTSHVLLFISVLWMWVISHFHITAPMLHKKMKN